MELCLKSNETITIKFDWTDGEIRVSFTDTNIKVEADLPDQSGRQGVIYDDTFGAKKPGTL